MNKTTTSITPARRIKRVFAACIDTLLAIIGIGIISIPLYFSIRNNLSTPTRSTTLGLTLLAMLTGAFACLVCLIYEVLLPYLWHGQSFGMRIMKIKIVDEKGEEVKLRQLLVRAISVVFTFITTAGISLIVEIFIVSMSVDHRSFNDTISRIFAIDYTKDTSVLTKKED